MEYEKTNVEQAHADLTYVEIWGSASACKIKGETIPRLDKVLIEFISFDKDSKKSTGAIKIYLDFADVIKLRKMIDCGSFKERAAKNKTSSDEEKKNGGKGYGKPVFSKQNMGSVSQRKARSFDIEAPGMQSAVVLVAREGEADIKDMGGGKKLITFKDFKSARVIRVPATIPDIMELAERSYMMFLADMVKDSLNYKSFSERNGCTG